MKKSLLFFLFIAVTCNATFAQPCLPEGITFTTQEQIDNFQTNYPGCTEIEGDVTILGDDITNLNGLLTLNSIGGNFTIGVYYGWDANPLLEYLTGLENLVSVGGNLTINGNSILVNLSGLENLSSAGGNLSVSNNPVLIDISDLGSLISIAGDLILGIGNWLGYPLGNPLLVSLSGLEGITSLAGLQLIGNHTLTDLSGLNNLYYVTGSIKIGGNNGLTSLSGMNALISIGGNLEIGYAGYSGWVNNPSLNDLAGLEGLIEIGGDLQFGGSNLVTLQGINNLSSIGNDLIFLDNGSITNLEGLDNLDFVGGNFLFGPYPGTGGQVWIVDGNNSMQSFTGMETLDYIGGDLVISRNYSLSSLSGIESLVAIGDDLIISENANLTSISGLENIVAASVENLEIHDNSLLNECEIQSICDFLSNPNGTAEIHDNAPGCNSPEEVIDSCMVLVEEIELPNTLRIVPNPSEDVITISLPSLNGNILFTVFNVNGEKVLEKQLFDYKTQLDINTLPEGVYFARVQDEKRVEVTKMIKQ